MAIAYQNYNTPTYTYDMYGEFVPYNASSTGAAPNMVGTWDNQGNFVNYTPTWASGNQNWYPGGTAFGDQGVQYFPTNVWNQTAPQESEEEDISPPEGVYPSSYTGLPQWAQDWAKSWWDKNAGVITGDYMNVMQNYRTAPGLIEQLRTLLPEQYRQQMDQQTRESVRPVLENMSNRGILNSSITGTALGRTLSDQQRQYADLVSQANTWAAQSQLQNLADQVGISERAMNILLELLGSQRYSESSDPWAPWRDILNNYVNQGA
jgi:hypothetical protein